MPEAFDKKKAVDGLVSIRNPILWWKDFVSIFNVRKLIIIAVIVGAIFGYGYFKGQGETPLTVDLGGKHTVVSIGEKRWLHFTEKGELHITDNEDYRKSIYKYTVQTKDAPNLYARLKPYGFQFKPIGVLGGGISGGKADFEGGIGASWFKWFKWRADSSITNKGLYPLGVSYKITDNSAVGISGGVGFDDKENQRVILKYSWEF